MGTLLNAVRTTMAKLPTWRGIAYFLHVASHWENISRQLEEYRKQIKDREDWAKAMLDQQRQLFEGEKATLSDQLAGARIAETVAHFEAQRASSAAEFWKTETESMIREASRLAAIVAVRLRSDSRRVREEFLEILGPAGRKLVEDWTGVLPRRPPPPPGLEAALRGLLGTGDEPINPYASPPPEPPTPAR